MNSAASELLRQRYRILEPIGSGGDGVVYKGRDENLGRDVAIKFFRASAEETKLQRQEDEVNVLAGLNHHGLVTMLDAGIDREGPLAPRIYFVMELVEGRDLDRRLLRGPLTAREIANLGFDLAEALQYLHHRGVVHRDLKPSNVLLVDYNDESTRQRAKLADFGIAVAATTSRITGDGITNGTAAYLSPEQVEQGELTAATDVYSLGLVLLQCFTATVEYPGDPVPSAIARLHREPVIPTDLPSGWRSLLASMTARQPDERPDASQIMQRMRQLVIAESGKHRADEHESGEHQYPAEANLDLGAPTDGAFDRIASIAARVLNASLAIVSMVDHDRIWFASRPGADTDNIGGLDLRALTDAAVARDAGFDFHVSAPLVGGDGQVLGALCVIDVHSRMADESELATLDDLAAMVTRELKLRAKATTALHSAEVVVAESDPVG